MLANDPPPLVLPLVLPSSFLPLRPPVSRLTVVASEAAALSMAVCIVGHSCGSPRAEPPSPQEHGAERWPKKRWETRFDNFVSGLTMVA